MKTLIIYNIFIHGVGMYLYSVVLKDGHMLFTYGDAPLGIHNAKYIDVK